jgi:predicted dehydrogenase
MALRVAVVGAGPRGREWARQIAALDGFELAACVDVDAGARATASVELPGVPVHSSLDEAVDAGGCDAAVIATPAFAHREPAELALARGLATLVEKPLAGSLEDAAVLVELAEREGVPLVAGQNFRYTRAHRTVRRLVQSDALGRVQSVVCQSYRVPELRDPNLPPDVLPLWGAAVHHLDALRHTIGELSGVMAERFGEASMQVLLAFENGVRGVYSATYDSSGHEFFERGQEFYERVVGDRATLHVFHRWLVLCPRHGLPRPIRRGPRPQTEEEILIRQLEHALRTGAEPEVSGRDNLRTIAALEACVRSAEERAWVDPRELVAAHA